MSHHRTRSKSKSQGFIVTEGWMSLVSLRTMWGIGRKGPLLITIILLLISRKRWWPSETSSSLNENNDPRFVYYMWMISHIWCSGSDTYLSQVLSVSIELRVPPLTTCSEYRDYTGQTAYVCVACRNVYDPVRFQEASYREMGTIGRLATPRYVWWHR